MGRGRAKAKQVKVARQLKYGGGGTDLDRLRAELGVGTHQRYTGERDAYADHRDRYSYADDAVDELDDEDEFGDEDEEEQDPGAGIRAPAVAAGHQPPRASEWSPSSSARPAPATTSPICQAGTPRPVSRRSARSASGAATTATMPTPRLNTRSSLASHPAGSTRAVFAASPPPVMWAKAWTSHSAASARQSRA